MSHRDSSRRFGTFGGVFTPCTLTILGVIMFLRMGNVVGQAGIVSALIILALSKVVSTVTAASLSAIATNTRVKGGGAYYLISRSLGVEYGAAIGIFFFLAQAIAVSMYIVGFTEAFLSIFPQIGLSQIAMASAVNFVCFIFVFIGAGWTIRLQYAILVVLALSIASYVAGSLPQASWEIFNANLHSSYREGQSFASMFALFFPAVTGIMAGANMSGDLRDPKRSLPVGTFAAVALTAAVYAMIILLLGAASNRENLVTDSMLMQKTAMMPMLITAGIFSATLSSALGSMMGAPRILQALSKDNIFRWLRPFARISGSEPRPATIMTFIIAQMGIMLGNLDAIAPVITMFFMITYGTLNLACFYESFSGNPSFRPTFRFHHWSLALFGAAGCVAVMLLMNWVWTIVAVLCMGSVYWMVSRAEIVSHWGDVTSGVALERARKALLKLEDERYHPKNWRPIILALSTSPWSRTNLGQYAYWLAAGRGILSLGHVISGQIEDRMTRRESAERILRRFIAEEELAAFPVVVVEEDLGEGIKSLLQSHGIGGVRPNTVLLGYDEVLEKPDEFIETVGLAARFSKNVVCVRLDEGRERWTAPDGNIVIVWPGAREGALLLIFSHLIHQNKEWRDRPRLIACPIPEKANRQEMLAKMHTILDVARIEAEAVPIAAEMPLEQAVRSLGEVALTLVSFSPPGDDEDARVYTRRLAELANLPGDVMLVFSSGEMSIES